jgi:hypothetical protein
LLGKVIQEVIEELGLLAAQAGRFVVLQVVEGRVTAAARSRGEHDQQRQAARWSQPGRAAGSDLAALKVPKAEPVPSSKLAIF